HPPHTPRDLPPVPTRRSSDLTPPCRCPSSRTWLPPATPPATSASCPSCTTWGGCTTSSTTRPCSRCARNSTTTSAGARTGSQTRDRKSTRLNSSHVSISYAVF